MVKKLVLLLIAAAVFVPGFGETATVPPPAISGEKNATIILANFSNTSAEPFTAPQVQERLFGAGDSLSAFFRETSYGKLRFSGKVVGWVKLAAAQTCQPNQIFTQAVEAARQSKGFDRQSTGTVIVVAPFGPGACGWIGYNAGHDGLIAVSTQTPSLERTIAHELGHEWGMLHAAAYECGEAPLLAQGCILKEYGDSLDPMGSSLPELTHFNAPHKDFAGWLGPGDVLEAGETGSYEIGPLELDSRYPKALKIARKENEYFYVEYRRSIGADSALAQTDSSAPGGALIHLVIGNPAKTYLVFSRPLAGQAGFAAGEEFVDPVSGLGIKAVSATTQALSLEVSFSRGAGLKAVKYFPSGTLVADKGTIYLIRGQEKLGFANMAAFRGLGYSLKNVILGDTSRYAASAEPPINSANRAHPAGSWVSVGKTVYYVSSGGLVPVPSWQVFSDNGGSAGLLAKANSRDLEILGRQGAQPELRAGDARIMRA